MSGTGSVGGAGGGKSTGGSGSANRSASDSSKSAGKSGSGQSNTASKSKSSASTGDSLSSSKTTADSLAGGTAARSSRSDSGSTATGSREAAENSAKGNSSGKDKNSSPAPGTGSMDAAATAAQNSTAISKAESVTPDTPAPTFDDAARAGKQTHESRTSAAGIAGTLAQGSLDAAKDVIDRSGRASAAATLTRGNAGNLPAKGFNNRTGLANALTNPVTNATDALKTTPYGPKAISTQQLTSAAKTAGTIGKVGGTVGIVAGPLMGAYEGFKTNPADATVGEKIANVIGSAAKELDDSAVSFVAGAAATGATLFAAAASGPAAPVVAASTPATATGAAIVASNKFDGSSVDKKFDSAVENYVEPAIASIIDGAVSAWTTVKSWF